MASDRYTITLVHPDGATDTETRARKSDALKLAANALERDGYVAYTVHTPGGDLVASHAYETPTEGRGRPIAPRIPAGVDVWECEGCHDVRPGTKFPTTSSGGRRTECRRRSSRRGCCAGLGGSRRRASWPGSTRRRTPTTGWPRSRPVPTWAETSA